MIISSASGWLPRLLASRAVSTSPVVQRGGSLASKGQNIFLGLRGDIYLVGIFVTMFSLAGTVIYSVSG